MLNNEYIKQTFERFAKVVVKQARTNLTKGGHKASGLLYKSLADWTIDVSKAGSVSLKFELPEYAVYQDKGVKGAANFKSHRMAEFTPYKFKDKMPPQKEIKNWVRTKSIRFRDKKGRFISHEQTAFIIQRSIYQKGIPQTLFFTKPFRRGYSKLPSDIIKAFGQDVDRFLTANFEDKNRLRNGGNT